MKLIIPIGWTLLMAIVLLLPGSSIPKTDMIVIPHLDKFIHFILFGGLVFFWGFYLKDKKLNFKWKEIITALVVAAISFGIAIEFIQGYVILSRSFDKVDIMANSLGAISAAVGIFVLKIKEN